MFSLPFVIFSFFCADTHVHVYLFFAPHCLLDVNTSIVKSLGKIFSLNVSTLAFQIKGQICRSQKQVEMGTWPFSAGHNPVVLVALAQVPPRFGNQEQKALIDLYNHCSFIWQLQPLIRSPMSLRFNKGNKEEVFKWNIPNIRKGAFAPFRVISCSLDFFSSWSPKFLTAVGNSAHGTLYYVFLSFLRNCAFIHRMFHVFSLALHYLCLQADAAAQNSLRCNFLAKNPPVLSFKVW